jgi:hypothetical protein
MADDTAALCTLQFSWGGLVTARPADDYAVHLVRQTAARGTPGPTLCGIDRFAEDAPGWSVGGGFTGRDITHKPCPGCASAAREQFPGLPIAGSVGAREMAAELGVGVACPLTRCGSSSAPRVCGGAPRMAWSSAEWGRRSTPQQGTRDASGVAGNALTQAPASSGSSASTTRTTSAGRPG